MQAPSQETKHKEVPLCGAAFYAGTFRGGIESIHRGQWAAARARGLWPWRALRLVILPQALKPMPASYINQSVTQQKNTSQVSTIAAPDLVYNATPINAETYRRKHIPSSL